MHTSEQTAVDSDGDGARTCLDVQATVGIGKHMVGYPGDALFVGRKAPRAANRL